MARSAAEATAAAQRLAYRELEARLEGVIQESEGLRREVGDARAAAATAASELSAAATREETLREDLQAADDEVAALTEALKQVRQGRIVLLRVFRAGASLLPLHNL